MGQYLDFCLALQVTDEEAAWCREALARMHLIYGYEKDGDPFARPPWLTSSVLDTETMRAREEGTGAPLWDELDSTDGSVEIWVYSQGEQYGCPDLTATFALEFLRAFRPSEVITFSVGYYGDRPSPSNNGGAVYVVTKDNVRSIYTSALRDHMLKNPSFDLPQ